MTELRQSAIRACTRLALVGACALLPGTVISCASITDVSMSRPTSSSVVFQTYDLPATLESNAVIEAAERSFTRALSVPPRTTEGSVSSPLPAAAPSFAIEDRRVELDRLGIVTMPTVVCPHSLALLQGFAQNAQGSLPFRYTGCIQFYAGGYRVHFIASAMLSGEDRKQEMTDVLERLGGDFAEQFAETGVASVSGSTGSTPPVAAAIQTASAAGLSLPRDTGVGAELVTSKDPGVAASPLVCLSASKAPAPIRSERGGGRIVGELEPGSVVAVMEPADPSYFWVQTEEQHTGWVDHVDVKRLRCPVG